MGRPARLQVDIVTDAKGASRGIDEADARFSKLGGSARKLGKTAAVGFGLVAAGVTAVGVASVKSASRQQQAFGALDSVYGKNARTVKKWAADAADSVGLARSEYAELSTVVGSQLQNMGVSQKKSAKASDELIRKGADLAATYGGSVADAVSAVSSLMRGEADPIERYGVSIKAVDINARLAATGQDKLTGAAAKQARTQALLGLLTDQTAKTQGAFARESNTLAGQQERLRAKFENIKATIGARLIPMLTRLMVWFGERVLPGMARLGRYLSSTFGPVLARVGAWINNRLVPAARSLWDWFVNKIAPGLRRTFSPVIEAVRRGLTKLASKFQDNDSQGRKLLDALRVLAEFIANKVLPVVAKLYSKYLTFLFNALGTIIEVAGRVVTAFVGIYNAISSAIEKIGEFIKKAKDAVTFDIPLVDFAANVTHGVVHTWGRSPSYDSRRGVATAATDLASAAWVNIAGLAGSGQLAAAGGVYIDRRDYSQTTIEGVTDVDELVRRLDESRARRHRRFGDR